MSNKKTEFDNKGISNKLIIDSGNSYQNKNVFRGDNKDLVEKNFKKFIDNSFQGAISEDNKR
jgi:hypothetical protein